MQQVQQRREQLSIAAAQHDRVMKRRRGTIYRHWLRHIRERLNRKRIEGELSSGVHVPLRKTCNRSPSLTGRVCLCSALVAQRHRLHILHYFTNRWSEWRQQRGRERHVVEVVEHMVLHNRVHWAWLTWQSRVRSEQKVGRVVAAGVWCIN